MLKKQGTIWTAIQPHSFENHDQTGSHGSLLPFEFHVFYSTSQSQTQPKNPQQWGDEQREREREREREVKTIWTAIQPHGFENHDQTGSHGFLLPFEFHIFYSTSQPQTQPKNPQ